MRTPNSFLWERSFIGLRSIDEPATHIPDLASKTCTKPTLGTPRSASAVTHSSSGRIIARVSGQSNGSCFFGYGKRRSLTSMPRDVARETQQGITSPIEWTSNMASQTHIAHIDSEFLLIDILAEHPFVHRKVLRALGCLSKPSVPDRI